MKLKDALEGLIENAEQAWASRNLIMKYGEDYEVDDEAQAKEMLARALQKLNEI